VQVAIGAIQWPEKPKTKSFHSLYGIFMCCL
jgi:hypothetical protein